MSELEADFRPIAIKVPVHLLAVPILTRGS
jgi:hypothetical protein